MMNYPVNIWTLSGDPLPCFRLTVFTDGFNDLSQRAYCDEPLLWIQSPHPFAKYESAYALLAPQRAFS